MGEMMKNDIDILTSSTCCEADSQCCTEPVAECCPTDVNQNCCSDSDTACCSENESKPCCDDSASACCSAPEVESCCSDSSDACCADSSAQACCEKPEIPISAGVSKGLITSLGFVALFVLGDYVLPNLLLNAFSSLPSKVAESLSFFISHAIGLTGILGAVTMFAVFVRSYINEENVRNHMSKMNTIKGHSLAAVIGVATPFCSCSAVPVFTGFVRSGVPVSQAISFLVASPLVNEVSIVMLAAWVGWQIAGLYAVTGFLIAIVAGLALRRIATPEMTEVSVARSLLSMVQESGRTKIEFLDRVNMALAEAKDIIRSTYLYILIGVGLGSLVHGWVPNSAIESIAALGPVIGVVAATALGIPLYSGIATVIPVVSALAEKGMPMGTLLAFSMSVTALSLPEAMLLRKVMKPKLLAAYFSTVAIGIVLVGISFNHFLGA